MRGIVWLLGKGKIRRLQFCGTVTLRSYPKLTKASYSTPTKEKALKSYLGFLVRKN